MCRVLKIKALFLILMGLSYMSHAEFVDHSIWDGLLKKYVQPIHDGQATSVDYAGFLRDRSELTEYLNALSAVSSSRFDSFAKDEQLAFLINAYNAWTVEFILTEYPNLESIKELGSFFRSPWKKEFIPLLGITRSLDDIEHNMIRGSGRFQDARIHFAVNCASIGCPALRSEAYTGDRLNAQLEEQTQLFLSDKSRNRLSEGKLEVSSIFKWYREDFEKGWNSFHSLEAFFIAYAKFLNLNDRHVLALNNEDLKITFLDYDWRLNKK